MWTRLLLSVTCVLSVVYVFHVYADEINEVVTPVGTIKGKVVEVQGGGKVATFLGIPYGRTLERFSMPTLYGDFETGVYYATKHQPACMQEPPKDGSNLEYHENCLFLNIWVPLPRTPGRAVMVYFHGGQNERGSASDPEIDGSVLALQGDVIVVTFNYRLGAYGWFQSLSNPASSVSNMGLKDQQTALRWVHGAISAFGGDPQRVTLFGQGEGAANIAFHLGMTVRRGYFQRIILQSMPNIMEYYFRSSSIGGELADAIKDKFRCGDGNVVECMRRRSREEITAVTKIAEWHEALPIRWGPVVDNWVVESKPGDLLNNKHYKNIDVMLGVNKNDGVNFIQPDGKIESRIQKDPEASFHRESSVQIARAGGVKSPKTVRSLYQPSNLKDPQLVSNALAAMMTDRVYTCPTNRFASLLKDNAVKNVYLYQMTYEENKKANNMPQEWGASHGAEIQWVFGAPMRNDSYTKYEVRDEHFSRSIMDKWVQFAKYGDPVFEEGSEWDPFSKANHGYLELNSRTGTMHVKELINEEKCDHWQT